MRKILNPCMCDVYGGEARGFAEIQYKDGKLSICGVIGPMRNGNCKGSCGQCTEEIRKGRPVSGWTDEMLQKFCDIWDEWHLNDMRPYCEHQKQLGWNKLASTRVTLYHYHITSETSKSKKEAETAALNALRNGEVFSPSAEQVMYATIPYSVVSHEELSGETAKYYEPQKALYAGDRGPTEEKTLGWLKPEEHPDGILCKPCPICGYKYGSAWKREDVPQDIIDWLFSLPDTEVQPAWV